MPTSETCLQGLLDLLSCGLWQKVIECVHRCRKRKAQAQKSSDSCQKITMYMKKRTSPFHIANHCHEIQSLFFKFILQKTQVID